MPFDPEREDRPVDAHEGFHPEKPHGFRSTDVYIGGAGVYLKYQDLEAWAKSEGRPPRRVLVIKDWGVVETTSNFEESKGKKRKQCVISFDVPDDDPFHGKWLGLNVTNDQRIRALVGTDDPEVWIGHAIQLLISETTRINGGPKVPCLRINEGLVWTPEQVKEEERRQMAPPVRKPLAPPPSIVSGSRPMTRVQDSFTNAVPPEEPHTDEASPFDESTGTVKEEFRNQF